MFWGPELYYSDLYVIVKREFYCETLKIVNTQVKYKYFDKRNQVLG